MNVLKKWLLVIIVCSVFGSCVKKLDELPKGEASFNIIGEWKVTGIEGTIDSTITINNLPYKTTFKTTYDNVLMQTTQTINNQLYAKYPYSLKIRFNDNGTDVVTQTMTYNNNMGISTPYDFTMVNTWNYTKTKTEADGLNIRGFANTSVLGISNINPAQGSSRYIQRMLDRPFFTNYDVQNGQLILYVHVIYTDNPDTPDGDGGTYNPFIEIKADYKITFTKL
jgi:hypothetical protein